jgi:hypothetical protein
MIEQCFQLERNKRITWHWSMEEAVKSFIGARSTLFALAKSEVDQRTTTIGMTSKRKLMPQPQEGPNHDRLETKRLRSSARLSEMKREVTPTMKITHPPVEQFKVANIITTSDAPPHAIGLCPVLPCP